MTNKKEAIPEFKSEKEEAEFWDTHSPLDYMPEPKPQKVKVRVPKDKPLTIRLDSEYRNKLESLASNYRMGSSTLARAIITNTIDQIVNRKQIAMTLDDAMDTLFADIPVEIRAEAEQLFLSSSIPDPANPEKPSYLMLNVDALIELTRKFWTHILKSQGYMIVPARPIESTPAKKESPVL